MTIQLPSPTGDDTRTLQAAIDAATYPTSGYRQGAVYLDGEYKISDTLRVAPRKDQRPVSLIADHAAISWIGPQTDKPMIEYHGEGMTAAVRIKGLLLDANHKARGIAVYYQRYGASFENLFIRGTRQVGLDMIGCWGSRVTGVTFQSCHGINLRLHGSNTALIQSMRFSGVGDDWPDEDDATVVDWDGKPLRTPAAERACIVSTSRTGNLCGQAWIIESAKYAGYPLLNYQAKRLRLTSLHVESCQCSEIFREHTGYDNVIDGLWEINVTPPTSSLEAGEKG
jgi:hypothetical protein